MQAITLKSQKEFDLLFNVCLDVSIKIFLRIDALVGTSFFK